VFFKLVFILFLIVVPSSWSLSALIDETLLSIKNEPSKKNKISKLISFKSKTKKEMSLIEDKKTLTQDERDLVQMDTALDALDGSMLQIMNCSELTKKAKSDFTHQDGQIALTSGVKKVILLIESVCEQQIKK